MVLEPVLDGVEVVGGIARPGGSGKAIFVNLHHFRMGEMGFFSQIGTVFGPVQLSGKIKMRVSCPISP